MDSPNLSIPQVHSNQNQKELTINDAIDQLTLALTSEWVTSVTTDIDADTFHKNMLFSLNAGATADCTFNFPDEERALFLVRNYSTHILTVTCTALGDMRSWTVAADGAAIFCNDNSGNSMVRLDDKFSGGGSAAALGGLRNWINLPAPTAGVITIDSTMKAAYVMFHAVSATADFTIAFPDDDIPHSPFVVANTTGYMATVTPGGGLDAVNGAHKIPTGKFGIFYDADVDNGMFLIGGTATGGASTQNLSISIPGQPSADLKAVCMITQSLTLPAGLTGTVFRCLTLPTADWTFQLIKYSGSTSTVIGSVTLTATGGGSVSFGSAVTFGPGDAFILHAPSTPDTTAKDVGFTFLFNVN
jgi:hypothetical protein